MIEQQQTTWMSGALTLMLLALLSALVVLPLGVLFLNAPPSDGTYLETVRALLLDSVLQQATLRTVTVALLACALASAIALPAAFVAVRSGPYVRLLIQLLGFLPLTMPPFVSAAVIRHAAGVFNQSDTAQTLGELPLQGNDMLLSGVFALHYLPFILFSVMAGLGRIDRAQQESARNLGAGRLRVWGGITLRLVMPAYAAGASLVMLKILEDVGTPLLLGIDGMLAPQILLRLGAAGFSDPLLNVSALVLLVISILIVAVAWSALIPSLGPTSSGRCAQPMRWRAGYGSRIAVAVLALALGMIALAPHLWLLLMAAGDAWSGGLLPGAFSLAHFRLPPSADLPLLTDTLLYAAAAGFLLLSIGSACGALTKAPGPFGRAVRFAVTALFAVPAVVLALAYARSQDLFATQLAGWTGLGWLALVVALKQLPLAQRLLAWQLQMVHQGPLESAHTLGASRFGAYLRLALPTLSAAFGAVVLLGMTAALVELSAALLLIRDPQALLALQLYETLRAPADAVGGAPLAVLLIGLVAAGLLLALAWLRTRCRPHATMLARQNRSRKDL